MELRHGSFFIWIFSVIVLLLYVRVLTYTSISSRNEIYILTGIVVVVIASFFALLISFHQNNKRYQSLVKNSALVTIVILALLAGYIGATDFDVKPKLVNPEEGLNKKENTDLEVKKNDDLTIESIISLTNIEREKAHLSSLNRNTQLDEAAKLKAENMIKEQYWAHFGPHNESPWTFISKAGYHYQYAGENLAKDFNSSNEVVDAWMGSPEHRVNILRPVYSEVGVTLVNGFSVGLGTNLVVQMFGTPSGASGNTGNNAGHINSELLDINEINAFLTNLKEWRSSWQASYGRYPKEKIDKLLDLFNRQIDFSQTLVDHLSGGNTASAADVQLWQSVVKMSNESATITRELSNL